MHRVLLTTAIVLFTSSLFGPHAAGQQPVPRNQYGAPVRTPDGHPINYSTAELAWQAANAQPGPPPPAALGGRDGPGSNGGGEARWGYFAFGYGIGLCNICVSRAGAFTEIISSAGTRRFWMILRFDPASQEYEQVFVSPVVPANDQFVRLRVADVDPSPGPEIIVAFASGTVQLWSQQSRRKLHEFQAAITSVNGLFTVDIDRDNDQDILLCSANRVAAHDAHSGALLWQISGVGGQEIVAGQMDGDPALEIATTDGNIVDAATRQIEWTWPAGFGFDVEAADIDNDGLDELIVADRQDAWAFDVDRRLPKWSIGTFGIEAITVGDIDSDGTIEVILGQDQWGQQRCYDSVTRQLEWSIPNTEHGTTANAFGDVDGDNQVEYIWGSGYTSSGPDRLFVADWLTQTIEWRNDQIDYEFYGPLLGDLTGDLVPELIAVSASANSGFDSGRIVVFDSLSLQRVAISPPVESGAGIDVTSIELANVDQDPALEIVVGLSDRRDARILIFEFDGTAFTTLWKSPFPSPSLPGGMRGVRVADIDGDNNLEVIGGATNYVYSFDYTTAQLEWQSPLRLSGSVEDVVIGDTDGDNVAEVHALMSTGDVYVFDGKTGESQAVLNRSNFTAMRLTTVGKPLLMLGDDRGLLWLAPHDGSKYGVVGGAPISVGRIDGFTFFESLPLLTVGSLGRLRLWVPPGIPAWNSTFYAISSRTGGFGSHTVILPNLALGVTAGYFGLSGFRP